LAPRAISFGEAVERLRLAAAPLGKEIVPLTRASRRVLAVPVVAGIDSPRADGSSMDGYAVRDEDLGEFPLSLRVAAKSTAGGSPPPALEPKTCVRISTGAQLPRGADRVVIQEEVRRDGDTIVIDRPPSPARFIRSRGGDFCAGETLLRPGRVLDERAIVAAAAADLGEVEVFARPRLSIISTGDELVEPGTARDQTTKIPDSVSLGLALAIERWGGICSERLRLGDDLALLERSAASALEKTDGVIVTGGASVGDRDFAKSMFEPLGLELIFSRVAIRPGMPAWFGKVQGKPVIGLPGNPTSALVTARLFLAPLVLGLTGRNPDECLHFMPVKLLDALPACDARETFHRGKLVDGAVEILKFQESSAQKALAEADVLVRQPAGSPAVLPGETVEILSF
jgi:molybdopterin molybdotransferase